MTVNTQPLRELLAGLPLVKWSKTGSTVEIPETEDFAGKQLPITGLDKQYARRLAAYIAAANPATVSALLDEIDALRAELQARQWQPIETAPVGNNPDGAFWCLLAYGPADDQSIGHGFRWHDKWYAAGTFYRLGQERQYELRETEVQPTHWMPRPELPDDLPPAPPQGDGA